MPITMKMKLSPTKAGELYMKWSNLVEEVKAKDEEIKNNKAQIEALEEMLSECTSHGELDSRLFNSFMEHAIKA